MSYDAATRAKMEQYGVNEEYGSSQNQNPVNAQPVSVAASSYSVGTVAAPPTGSDYHPYAQQVYVQPAYGVPQTPQVDGTVPRRQYPRNRWGDSICDWPLNIFPSCYCVCCFCCGMWLTAQIGQKTGFTNFPTPIWIFVVLCIIGFFLQIFVGAGTIVWVPMIFAFLYATLLRVHIARKENISECPNIVCGEFCVGFWCWYCSVAQMARHVYGYNKVMDGDGDPYRPDNYAPMQQV